MNIIEEIVTNPTDIVTQQHENEPIERPKTGTSSRFVKSVKSVVNFRTI